MREEISCCKQILLLYTCSLVFQWRGGLSPPPPPPSPVFFCVLSCGGVRVLPNCMCVIVDATGSAAVVSIREVADG